ncbi:MAG: hypothetical protein PHO30_00055 [Candidatus Omnitrophica bacterium]|nr:hypothetical protein [Candidatus Omnitrophota bacterium]
MDLYELMGGNMFILFLYFSLISLWLNIISTVSFLGQMGYGSLDILTKLMFFIGFLPSKLLGLMQGDFARFAFSFKLYFINMLTWGLLGCLIWVFLVKSMHVKETKINLTTRNLIWGFLAGNLLSILIIIFITMFSIDIFHPVLGFIIGPIVFFKFFAKQQGALVIIENIYYIFLSTYFFEITAKHRNKFLSVIFIMHLIFGIFAILL